MHLSQFDSSFPTTFYPWAMVTVAQLYDTTKSHPAVYSEWVNFMRLKLYLSKAVSKESQRPPLCRGFCSAPDLK